jgi:hypothetical protein
MREIPADFEVKKANYLSVATNIIRQLNIPKQLNYALDETNVMFVSRASRTRSKKGSKRVRLIGIGKDKAQITVTLAIVEEGRTLPPQYIFGGKTNACHPKKVTLPPERGYFTHSTSHWCSVNCQFVGTNLFIFSH